MSVATPVSSVGCRTGAKRGLWFVGSSPMRPACLRLRIDIRIRAADEPEDGGRMPLRRRTIRKSSLADVGSVSPYAICGESASNASKHVASHRDRS